LYARIGTPHCPQCGEEIKPQSIDEIVDKILALKEGTKIQIIAPVVRGKKGEFTSVLNELAIALSAPSGTTISIVVSTSKSVFVMLEIILPLL
jgi:hypothetical protein